MVTRWWQKIRGGLLVAGVNFVVAASIALVAAMLALVVEDLLPVSGDRHLSLARFTVLVAAVLGLFGAIVWRGRVHRRTGTLFYVRIIDDAMLDLHTVPLDAATRRRMSLKTITRWVDLAGSTSHGVIDLADVCAEVAAALEAVVNGDRDDTAYTIAPNMLWQPALAVGAELPIVNRLHLLELGPPTARPSDRTETMFVWPAAAPTATTVTREPPQPLVAGGSRAGLLLAFAPAAQKMDPARVFAGFDVAQCHRIYPAWVDSDLRQLTAAPFSRTQLSALAAALPATVADIKKEAGPRDLVVAAAMPKTLAVALGWGLAHSDCRFFGRTYLLHYDRETDSFTPVRVHPSQPEHRPQPGRHA